MTLPVGNNPNPYNILVQSNKKNSLKLRIGNRVKNLNKLSSRKNRSAINLSHPSPNTNNILGYQYISSLSQSSRVSSRPILAMTTASINTLPKTLTSSR